MCNFLLIICFPLRPYAILRGSSNAIVAARNWIDGNNGARGKQRELGHVTVDRYQLFSNYEFRRHIVQLIYSRRRVPDAIYSRCTVASIFHATIFLESLRSENCNGDE